MHGSGLVIRSADLKDESLTHHLAIPSTSPNPWGCSVSAGHKEVVQERKEGCQAPEIQL